jgi:hypothetical protein
MARDKETKEEWRVPKNVARVLLRDLRIRFTTILKNKSEFKSTNSVGIGSKKQWQTDA